MSERNMYADHALAVRYLLVDRQRCRGDRFEYDRLAAEVENDGLAVSAMLGHMTAIASELFDALHGDDVDAILVGLIAESTRKAADEPNRT
ncbi:hypothetical protein O4160_03470 [Rhodococcus sp. IEGM 1401]|uniref:hypothetical protein n=1 Tax=unclassified Rhodococcus (in: high G+C Gram-positive bacteria) TaxID=192944 RepID=UPI0022B5E089|nr:MULTISPECIES: hypothetical protein [unclassified Rhodococcus (in: high G+C Gram-positive bacteria)]MCZ4559891.1 hypothetical protein [Rhodococcus sp. IEGM 1401]MDI9920065.1 hypothetical protein [Rhodococcus sp. IEGM 1372]MDV8032472.1 hypothetical protein [Rhodococcus sp. IEGM 1414]